MIRACYTNSNGDSIPCVIVANHPDETVDVARDEDSHVFIANAKVSPTAKAGFIHVLDSVQPKAEKPAAKK